MNLNKKFRLSLIAAYIVLIGYCLITLFPFFWSMAVSFTPMTYENEQGEMVGVDIMKWPPGINIFKFEFFDAPGTFNNYVEVFKLVPFARWILNTVIYAVVVTVANVFLDALGGYAFARLKFPLKNFWFMCFLATLMLPMHVKMIPMYNMMVDYGLVNTYGGLFLPKLTQVFGLFMMRQFFMGLPTSIEEAAKLDGASILTTYFKIILPMTKPAMAALSIYVFMGTWNDFLWPLLMTSKKEMFTLTMGLNFFNGTYYTFWQFMMAASLMITLPMIVIFISFQKQFIDSGISSGVKG
jgi:multiple sugar transport system permease protein